MLDYMETNGIWEAAAADYEDTGQYLLDRSYRPLKPQ
jgi:hypothetical protein